MTLDWAKNKSRYTAAKELIMAIMDSVYAVNANVEFALRAFGEQYNVKEDNCIDTKLEVMFSKNNKTQMSLRLDDLHPLGVTPIAYSLKQAADVDMDEQNLYYYGLVLITDGEESCGGNLCETMQKFVKNKINYKPYIVSLVDEPKLKQVYECVGNFLQATVQPDIPTTAGIIANAFRPDLVKIVKKDAPNEYVIKVTIPDVAYYPPGPVRLAIKLEKMGRVYPLNLDLERYRAVIPEVAYYKPPRLQLDIPMAHLDNEMPLQVDPERYRVAIPDVSFYKLPPLAVNFPLSHLPDERPLVAEPERYRIKIPDVDLNRTEIFVIYSGLEHLPQIPIEDMEQYKFRVKIPEVVINSLDTEWHIKPQNPGINVLGPINDMVRLNAPMGVCVDNDGNIYITDNDNARIRKVDTKGIISTIAGTGEALYSGDGGPAVKATLNHPYGITCDSVGNLYFSDRHNRVIRKIDTRGIISTIAGTGDKGYSGDGGNALDAELFTPRCVALDNKGNILFSDSARIRRVNMTTGRLDVAAGNGKTYNSAIDKDQSFVRHVGDGREANKSYIVIPMGVAVDKIGNIYIVDYGHFRLREVDTEGIINTIAGTGEWGYQRDGARAKMAKLTTLNGIAVDDEGRVYFTDGDCVRRIDENGRIYAVAGNGRNGYSGDGGPATDARLSDPSSIAFDKDGNIYITESGNNTVRKVDKNGIITTVAGSGKRGYSGDGFPAASVQAPQR
jgi:sugar lactone lactonase YvrE